MAHGNWIKKGKAGIVILLLLLLPVALFSLSDPDQEVKELEEKLKTASQKEKIQLLHQFVDKNMEILPDKSLEYARESLQLAEKLKNQMDIFLSLKYIGNCYYVKNQYREALKYYLEALNFESQVEEKKYIANLLTNIGMIYRRLEEYDMSEQYHRQGLAIIKEIGSDKVSIAYSLNNLGMALAGKKEYPQALEYYREALQLLKEAGYKRGMAAALNNIAEVYREHYKDYPTALDYFRQTLPLYEEIGLQWGVANARQNIGKTYIDLHQYETARTYLETALELAKKIKSQDLIYNIYGGFRELYKKKRDFKQALQYSKLYLELRDTLFNEKVRIEIARMQAKHEAENKDNEIRLLNKKIEVERLLRIFLVIAVVLILGIGMVFYLRMHTKKKANQMLRTSETKYRALFSGAGDAIFLAEGDTLVDCNEKALEMLDVSRDQVMDRTFWDFSPPTQPDRRDSFETGTAKIKKTLSGEPQRFSWQFIKKDSTPLDTMVNMTTVNINNQIMIQAMVHDISDRKRLEEERVKSAKLETISLLANGITHDFNNLFTVFLWKLEDARSRAQSHDRITRLLSRIEKAVDSATTLSKQFLAIAARGYHSQEILSIESTLREAVDEVLAEKEAEARCHFEICKDLPPINGDIEQIKEVFRHLTRNALNAMETQGKIQIKAANIELKADEVPLLSPGHYITISVQDNGKGIPQENLAKIFDPYFSTREEYSRKGLGMGLAIDQAIIKRHNGTITVSSQAGTGTIFYIYLPTCASGGQKPFSL